MRTPRDDPPEREGVTRVSARDTQVLVHGRTGATDTVAWVRRRPLVSRLQRDARGQIVASSVDYAGVWPSAELAHLFPDGALAVARLDPFRVDWRLPDGRWMDTC